MTWLANKCVYPADENAEGFSYQRIETCAQRGPTERNICWGTCCLRGCIIGTCVCLLFLVLLPAGFILMFLGTHQGRQAFIGVGVSVILVPLIVFPSSYIFYRWYWRKRKSRSDDYIVTSKNSMQMYAHTSVQNDDQAVDV